MTRRIISNIKSSGIEVLSGLHLELLSFYWSERL